MEEELKIAIREKQEAQGRASVEKKRIEILKEQVGYSVHNKGLVQYK